jgi:hypothetical protein
LAIRPQYAVSRDGRFLINQLAEESASTPITLILDWKPGQENDRPAVSGRVLQGAPNIFSQLLHRSSQYHISRRTIAEESTTRQTERCCDAAMLR